MVMAVERMEYVNIMGPMDMFDDFVLKHIVNRNIHLEPSYSSLDISGLIPFEDNTALTGLKKRMKILNENVGVNIKEYDIDKLEEVFGEPVDISEIEDYVDELEASFSEYQKKIETYSTQIKEKELIIKQLQPFEKLNIEIDEMFHFAFLKIRFGVVPKDNYQKQKQYIEELDVIVVPVSEDDENVWLSYFAPSSAAPVIDNVFSAIGFTRVWISEQVKGKPKNVMVRLKKEIEEIKMAMARDQAAFSELVNNNKAKFDLYYHMVLYLSKVNDIKKLSCHTQNTFYLVGWMPYKDYKKLEKEIESLEHIILSGEDPDDVVNSKPPTILKNRGIFKPFEALVSMYGLPSAKELDPTPLTTITYILMFGFMFGDVGQGAVIALFGLFLYKWKKSALGGIMMYVGISSTLFGFVYGSVFGNEEIINPLWASPLHGSDTINTLLYGAVGYGAVIIIVTMIANIINNIRMRRWGKLLFDKNGLAGLMFYGGLAIIILISLKTGNLVLNAVAIVIVCVIPALMILLREPLENLILRKNHLFPKEKGMYFVEASFELFEAILSFFSGTVSFARVGAFALNHAGLSLAVWTLYHMMEGVGGIIVVIIGNLLTIGLEGLIVAIQCMRLEYYELFGRFYNGDGRAFSPAHITDE